MSARLVAVRPRAARVTVLVLSAALVRAVLAPAGVVPSTAVFAASLIGILLIEGRGHAAGERQWPILPSVAAGAATGLLLLAPLLGTPAARPLGDFWVWAGVAAVIATLEEAVIRGSLQQHWTREGGAAAGLLVPALVFALIHLPRYGIGAMPLDLSVGLALSGLRAVSGRILPCAVAHVIADWGAWLFA